MIYFFLFVLLVCLFILGMILLRTGLFHLSSASFKKVLSKVTAKPWKALLVSTIITALLQSSSAVMVLTIGLISARILTFPQSIGIILGTNIGTTFTTEFITFNLDKALVPLAVIGCLFILFRKQSLRSVGFALLGIAIVFTAMRGFKYFASIISSNESITHYLLYLQDQTFLAILVGIILTAIIQSSSACTGIVMGFLSAGLLPIETGISIMLGSNIGTCITSYLASIGAEISAKLCAYAHIWLNIAGVLLFIPFIPSLTEIVESLTPHQDVQLAHASLIFNVITSLLVLPFAHSFGNFIMKIHKKS